MLNRVITLLLSLSLVFIYPLEAIAAPSPNTIVITKTKKPKSKRSSKKKAKAVTAAPIPSTLNIKDGIDQIVSKYPNLNIGVLIQSVDNGTRLYDHNANETFLPASTLKTLTAIAALTYLGPNFVFPTQIFTTAPKINNGILVGDLYVKFSGDPELSIQDLNNLIDNLEKQGIRQINGNLVIDDFDMDRTNMAPGWQDREQILNYAEPSNAIIINRNLFGFTILPTKTGDLVGIKTNPNLANITVINQAVTKSDKGCPLDLRAYGNNTGTNSYLLTGCLRTKKPIGTGVALNDTRAAGTGIIKYLLQQNNINITGQIYYQKTPPNLHLLAQHNSRPLSALVTKMLKKSDNLIAGALFKKLGGTYFNTMGSWQNGSQAVQAIIGPKTGIDFTKMMIRDGAGLSRFDWVSPNMFGKLLQYAYRMPFNNTFYQALPISGTDGTLRGRLGGPLQGKVHAKTGTMDGTSGLVGYVRTVNNQNLIFAILINNPNNGKGSQGTYHYIEDRIVQFIGHHATL